MPQNLDIRVKCSKDCYWNLGKYESNCSRKNVTITDKDCDGFISLEEAEKKLGFKIPRLNK
jgi:hypothetical protein